MARVTTTGIEAESLSDFTAKFRAAFRNALGQDLDVSVESPQGQLISQLALIFAQQDEAVVAVANGMSIQRALGLQLDDLGSLLGVTRLRAARSTVAVTLTGTAAAVVPQGSRARTAAGDVFRLTAAATIGPAGTVAAAMESVELGPIPAAAGALDTIVDLVAGWATVTNAAAARPGRLVESDVAYRVRYQRVLDQNAQSSADAILAAVLATEGVTDGAIHENVTALEETRQGVPIGARSFLVIVDGGTDAAVAAAIAATKPAGIAMSGDRTVQVPRSSGAGTTPIKFRRVTNVPLAVTVDITIGAGFPGDGEARIKQRLAEWAAGTWRSGVGDFDTSGLGIGEALNEPRLYSPIQSVPGHTVLSLAVTRKDGGGAAGTPDLDQRFTLAQADITVS